MLQGATSGFRTRQYIYPGYKHVQNAAPLVIIDGMEQPLTDGSNQVKSINIRMMRQLLLCMDHGSQRGYYCETHRGTTGQFSVNVNSWFAVHQPLNLPDFRQLGRFHALQKRSAHVSKSTLLYTESDIQGAEQGLSPNTDWVKEIMERTSTSHNTPSISGGGGVGTLT